MVKIGVVIPLPLREAMLDHVFEERMTMSEYITKVVSQALGRPDLGEFPRKHPGRKPKRAEEASAQ